MSGYTFPTSSQAEPFVNPYNPDFLSRVWRARQGGSAANEQLTSFPTSSVLTKPEFDYYYTGSDTK